MADKSYLNWPFFEARHRDLAAELDAWASSENVTQHAEEADVDWACEEILNMLGRGGWTRYAVPDESGKLDVRTLCLIRETLARYSGLADFVFAMQGLGSGPISLFG